MLPRHKNGVSVDLKNDFFASESLETDRLEGLFLVRQARYSRRKGMLTRIQQTDHVREPKDVDTSRVSRGQDKQLVFKLEVIDRPDVVRVGSNAPACKSTKNSSPRLMLPESGSMNRIMAFLWPGLGFPYSPLTKTLGFSINEEQRKSVASRLELVSL